MTRQRQHKVNGVLEVGSKAPDFTLASVEGKEVNLYDLLDQKNVVLVFYRGDWCAFCNIQLIGLKKDYQEFKELNAEIVAVSVDSVERERALSERLNLPFLLLSDPGHKVIQRYNVLNRNFFTRFYSLALSRGATWRGVAKPSIFIIGKDRIIHYKYVGKRTEDRPNNKKLLQVLMEIKEKN